MRFFNEWAGLFNTSFYQLGFYFRFLPGKKIYLRFISAVTRQLDFDAMRARADQHGSEFPAKFAGMPYEFIVQKNRGALRLDT